MAVIVFIPTALRQFAGDRAEVSVEAATVGEALDKVMGEHAELRRHLYSEQGATTYDTRSDSTRPSRRATPSQLSLPSRAARRPSTKSTLQGMKASLPQTSKAKRPRSPRSRTTRLRATVVI